MGELITKTQKIETDQFGASDLEIQTGANKTLKLTTSAWRDINLGAGVFTNPASSIPGEVQFVDNTGANTGIYTYGFAVGEKVSGDFEMQHDYKEGTDLYFHVHFQGNDAPTGTDKVRWQLTYTFMQDGETLAPATPITKECDCDTQYEAIRCDFDAIDGTDIKIGDQFLFTLERIAATTDEYAGDAVVATIGMHIQLDTLGSRQIGTK